MHIVLNYAYTQEQLKRAFRFNVFPTPRAKFFLLFFSCLIFCVGALVWHLPQPKSANPIILEVLKYIMLAIFLFWLFLLLAVLLDYFYYPVYAFKKSPYYQGNFTLNLIADGLAYKQQVVQQEDKHETDGFVSWKTFTQKAENNEFIVLYIGRKRNFIPKNAFANDTELQEFRTFLTEQKHIKSRRFDGKEIWDNF